MRVVVTPGRVHVTLSRRNLRALLSKLDTNWSARTIYTSSEDGTLVVVVAEDDPVHYADRLAGPMHPVTEQDIR